MKRTTHVLATAVAICGAILLCGRLAADAETEHQHQIVAPAAALAGESIYQLDIRLTTADGKVRALADLRGRPALITMFYASCQSTCPLLAFSMRRMEADLSQTQRARLQLAMISFDPGRDTPAALSEFGALHKLDASHWWLARTPEYSARELAAVLGVRYRETSGGVFSHSAVITLLDANGRIVGRTTKLDALEPAFMDDVRSTLDSR